MADFVVYLVRRFSFNPFSTGMLEIYADSLVQHKIYIQKDFLTVHKTIKQIAFSSLFALISVVHFLCYRLLLFGKFYLLQLVIPTEGQAADRNTTS